MGRRLDGRVALVSGSTRGIGRSIAEQLAAEGAAVAVTGRTVAKGERVVARIRESGGRAEFFPLDITNEDSVRSVLDSVGERFGSLHILVNNAAPTDAVAATIKPMAQYTNEEWNHILNGTLTANVFWMTKHAWPQLTATGNSAVINISSTQSLAGLSGFAAYAAAKGAMNSVTRVLAVEGAPHGVRCNCIVVGRVVVGRDDRMYVGNGGRLTRIGNPADIAALATFLASEDAAFLTGECIVADGGAHINGDALVAGSPHSDDG